MNGKLYSHLPSNPGVYLFTDNQGQVLYIGKALNLRKRVKNYFVKKNQDLRVINFINKVKKIDFIVTSSEAESLLLEAKLIKQHLPRYNIALKDDKRFLYVGITQEKYPRLKLLRLPEKEVLPLLNWYGPFPSAYALKEVLRLLRRIFPYCSCKKRGKKPCFYYHLKLCPAPHLRSQDKAYQSNIRNIHLFLSGRIDFLLKDLGKQMAQVAKDQKFEQAAVCKRQIQMIESLLKRFKKTADETDSQKALLALRKILVRYSSIDPIVIHRLEAYDIANLGSNLMVGSMAVFINGEPDFSKYRQFKITPPGPYKQSQIIQGDPAALKQIIARRLNHPEWFYPQIILVDGGKGQVSIAFTALKDKNLEEKIGLLGLVKRKESIVIPLIDKGKIKGWKRLNYAASNPALKLLQHARDESHRFAQRYLHKLQRKALLRKR